MRYIQKIGSPYESAGEKCTQTFLDNCWIEGQYLNLQYDKSQLGDMEKILCAEQVDPTTKQSYCCYCMRRLYLESEGVHRYNVTLEHIVPNHIDCKKQQADIKKYQQYPCLQDDHILICHKGELPQQLKTTPITRKPYPHFVSYHNLVASCNGRMFENGASIESRCCNNNRGNLYVEPLFLDAQKAQWIQYNTDGSLDYDDTIIDYQWFDSNHLNLATSWLCLVRHIWALVAGSSYTPDDVESAIQDTALRQDIIDDIDRKNEIADWTDNQAVWTLFAEYSWFYYYYQNQ